MASRRTRLWLGVALGIVGIVILLAGLRAATSPVHYKTFRTRVPPQPARNYDCGSVISPKDPRDLVPSRRDIQRRFQVAYQRCVKLRSSQAHRAEVRLVIGTIVLIAVLAGPALRRWNRRRRHKARPHLLRGPM